jgi:hypothetical protein
MKYDKEEKTIVDAYEKGFRVSLSRGGQMKFSVQAVG